MASVSSFINTNPALNERYVDVTILRRTIELSDAET
jgi:hypothetical protein